MTLTERLLARSRSIRRGIIYRIAKHHVYALGISTDGHGRGVIFIPRHLSASGMDDRESSLIHAGTRTLEHLTDLVSQDEFPAKLLDIIREDHYDYVNNH